MTSLQAYRQGMMLILALSLVSAVQASHEGNVFDPGLSMSARSEHAPEQLDQLGFYLGNWDVEYKTFDSDGNEQIAKAVAQVGYVNRGHGFLERLHSDDLEGHPLDTATMITYNAGQQYWVMGVVDSYKENVSMHNGVFKRGVLTLNNAVRSGGGIVVNLYKTRFVPSDDGGFQILESLSDDGGDHWKTTAIRTYRKREKPAPFFIENSGFGKPAVGLPAEAREFDFLIGEWDSSHSITLPNGQNVQFPANNTAVFALNGNAIVEFNWYDVDPSLPDAATTIYRIYNRAMRRWENLYLTNRNNGMLYFGGQKEGDNIVLHNFETDASSGSIPFYVFHSINDDDYQWYAETSTDRGRTYNKTWTISMTRKPDTAKSGSVASE